MLFGSLAKINAKYATGEAEQYRHCELLIIPSVSYVA